MPDVTERQLDVLGALIEEGNYSAAANRLGLSRSTVRNHLENLRLRLGVKTTEQAIYVLMARNQLYCPGLEWDRRATPAAEGQITSPDVAGE